MAGLSSSWGRFIPFDNFIYSYKGFWMSLDQLKKVIEDKSLPMELAQKYLKLYVADIDWTEHITALWKNSISKLKDEQAAKDHLKRAVACSVMLPYTEKTPIPDPASNLLFWCTGWRQFNQHDWFDIFIDVLKEDVKIINKRNKLIKMGVIDRVDIFPMTRQAFNWLYEKCSEDYGNEQIVSNDVKEKITNLVKVYGGAVICNIFINYKLNVDKVFNWRSGYFFEKEIHKIYSLDQIEKIKLSEMKKINSKHIKLIEQNTGAKNENQNSF